MAAEKEWKVGLVQLSVGDDPQANLPVTASLIREAAAQGARYVLTPECTNFLSPDRDWKARIMHPEAQDPTLAALRDLARELGIWLHLGSLLLRPDDPAEPRDLNRSLMIGPDGAIVARYDKIHMFDVTISETESYRESASYRPGARAVVVTDPARGLAPLGMTICYDIRFPALYRRLAKAGARVLAVPAAFNDTTGAAHWEVLLRARAIENGSFVLAAAQCGLHVASHTPNARARRSWGHSMAVAPWGEILADAGEEPYATVLPLDLGAVDRARSRVPSLTHDRDFTGP
ncbi:carbon-nitrogen hydrolase family protein [Paracoccus cavernae]|uniref:Carbon-nitrogen hydrolase family protein n=1 Tax=Paracoccus cavernae TaxID=1571207 RepID=A0ABT8D914_9RHOB|nr:carbon-nitrogen hydrolase family protein [Paracoccus cavernae]